MTGCLQLRAESEATTVFMINLLNVSEEAVVQVVLDKILDKCVRTALSEDTISNIVEYKNNSLSCAEKLDPKIQSLIDEIVPKGSGELIIIPILAKERQGRKLLIYTD